MSGCANRLNNAGVVETDSSREEGPVVPLPLRMRVDESTTEGVAQGSHSVMWGVGGVFHD